MAAPVASADRVRELLREAFDLGPLPGNADERKAWHRTCVDVRENLILMEPEDLVDNLPLVLEDFLNIYYSQVLSVDGELGPELCGELRALGRLIDFLSVEAPFTCEPPSFEAYGGTREEYEEFVQEYFNSDARTRARLEDEELSRYCEGLFSRMTHAQASAIYQWLRLVDTWAEHKAAFQASLDRALKWWLGRCRRKGAEGAVRGEHR